MCSCSKEFENLCLKQLVGKFYVNVTCRFNFHIHMLVVLHFEVSILDVLKLLTGIQVLPYKFRHV